MNGYCNFEFELEFKFKCKFIIQALIGWNLMSHLCFLRHVFLKRPIVETCLYKKWTCFNLLSLIYFGLGLEFSKTGTLKWDWNLFNKVIYIVWQGVSASISFFIPLSLETCNPLPSLSWHLSRENTRFYDDTPESGRLKTININPRKPITYRNCVS